jgi:capsular exopolysaccharide synthesis family protein
MTDASTAERAPTPTAPSDLAGVTGRYLRYAPLVAIITVVFLIVAGGLTFLQTPMYTAKTTLQFDPKKAQVGRDSTAVEDSGKDAAVDTQSEVLQSPALVLDVINTLHLDRDPEFNKDLRKAGQGVTPADPGASRNALITEVSKGLRAKRVGQTMLFELAFTDRDPIKAATIANTFADSYIKGQVQQKLDNARKSTSLLNSQMDQLRAQVETAEGAVQAFKARNNLLSTSGSTLTEQEISSLKTQEAIARVQLAEASAQLSAGQHGAAAGGNGDSGSGALASPVITNLRQQRADASRQLAELESKYGPLHPQVINQKKALVDTDTQIRAELDRINNNLRANVQVAQQRLASIQGSIAGTRSELVTGNAASVELAQLQRDADAAQTLYEAFLNRAKETTAQQATAEADARVNSIALPPSKPSSPNIAINMFLGLLFGLGLGVSTAFFIERWNVRLTTMNDVESRLHVAFLAGLPTLASSVKKPATKSPTEAILRHPLSGFAEAFRGLGTALVHGQDGGGVKVVAISSALPGEGKTTTSVCLARVMALGGSRVLLMDCDLRRRSATAIMAPQAAVGLIEVIEGRAALDDALIEDTASGCWFLPIAKDAHLAKSPITSPNFDALLDHLRSRFDVIVIDTAPILPVVDTRILSQKVDALALIVKWRATPMRAVQAAIHQIEAVDGIVSGVALSLIDLNAQARSGYGDPHYYYRDFKGYYLE